MTGEKEVKAKNKSGKGNPPSSKNETEKSENASAKPSVSSKAEDKTSNQINTEKPQGTVPIKGSNESKESSPEGSNVKIQEVPTQQLPKPARYSVYSGHTEGQRTYLNYENQQFLRGRGRPRYGWYDTFPGQVYNPFSIPPHQLSNQPALIHRHQYPHKQPQKTWSNYGYQQQGRYPGSTG